ncbi:N-acetylneuraminate lyase-like, partial [Physella acuta]|uniref:N-acetylneuraminate lyase-like n=1 Tax=Physella acuta TaxID=109671 RepID=UPI0027DDDF5A
VPKDFRINGIISAPATPLKDNGDVDTEAVESYVDFLANNDINGVFVLGTLGEGLSLTVEERKQVAAAWVKYGQGKLSSVIVHVGTGNLRDTIQLARHAGEVKATAIACMSPTYFRPQTEEIMVTYMEQVAAAAPDTPFYYYCINFMSGVNLNTARILQLADDRIPTLRGIKMSSRELPSLLDCTQVCGGKFDIMVGTDEQLLPALSLGVRTPVLNGYLGSVFKRMRSAFDSGDMDGARKEQVLARKIFLVSTKYGGGPAFVKAAMKCLGVEAGPVRLPLVDIQEDLLPSIKRDLEECGLPVK